jgi:hypothetical protein
MDDLNERIDVQMRKAFMDVLETHIAENDVGWLVRLYTEIRERLCSFVREGPTRARIHASFDVELFEQMLVHQAFDPSDMVLLVGSAFDTVAELQAPARDVATSERRAKVEAAMRSPGATLASVVPVFVVEVHACMDELKQDMAALRELAKARGPK